MPVGYMKHLFFVSLIALVVAGFFIGDVVYGVVTAVTLLILYLALVGDIHRLYTAILHGISRDDILDELTVRLRMVLGTSDRPGHISLSDRQFDLREPWEAFAVELALRGVPAKHIAIVLQQLMRWASRGEDLNRLTGFAPASDMGRLKYITREAKRAGADAVEEVLHGR